MYKFTNALIRYAIIISIAITIFLLLLIGLLIFAPELLWTIIRFGLIAVGFVAVIYLLSGIIKALCYYKL